MAHDSRSLDEIERDLADTRRHLDTTLDAIQSRMSPGAMFEDALDYIRRDGSAFGRNFVETVRDNPVPATLMTVGLGWMMISGRNGSTNPSGRYGALVPASERESHGPSAGDRLRGMGQSVRDQQEAAVHGTSQAAHKMSESARHGWDSARTGAESAMHRGRDMVAGVGEGTRSAGRSMAGFFEENPLAVGVMAVAAGAALAAFLPRTRTEDETLGPLRERTMEQGRAQAGRLADEATERGRAALNAAVHPESQRDWQESLSSGAKSGSGTESKTSGDRSGSSASPTSPSSAATPGTQTAPSSMSSARPMGPSPSASASGRTPPPSPSRP
ncbi:MAG: hypothetical protein VR70_00390 [Rhodospirillaceae bacterium BRH_c57]|nr:MAG: hypothetical protein VR70_00390 [Rhodospirillaceae bacterium BRH_c57]